MCVLFLVLVSVVTSFPSTISGSVRWNTGASTSRRVTHSFQLKLDQLDPNLDASTWLCVCVYVYTNASDFMSTSVHMYISIYVHMYVCTYACMCCILSFSQLQIFADVVNGLHSFICRLFSAWIVVSSESVLWMSNLRQWHAGRIGDPILLGTHAHTHTRTRTHTHTQTHTHTHAHTHTHTHIRTPQLNKNLILSLYTWDLLTSTPSTVRPHLWWLYIQCNMVHCNRCNC